MRQVVDREVMMTIDNAARAQTTDQPAPMPPVDPTVATLAAIQRQLAEQTHVLRAMHQELTELRTAQATNGVTMVKLERQLRWARWMRRIRTTIFALFWLGVVALLAYYWTDLSTTWYYWVNILRDF